MSLFHKDQMTLQLEKYNYTPGEVIKGYVKLALKKPLQGRKLTVAFRCTRIDTVMVSSMNSKGMPSSHMEKVRTVVYNFEVPLDSENTYFCEMYPFEITIPPDILTGIHSQSPGQSVNVFGFQIPLGRQPLSTVIEWTLNGQLDVPMKIDVKAEQQIVLSPKQ